MSDVLAAAQLPTGVMGAGFVENANQRIVLQTEGEALTAEVLGEVEITQHERINRRATQGCGEWCAKAAQ